MYSDTTIAGSSPSQENQDVKMAFHLVFTACILIYLYGASIVLGTSDFNLYTDGTCQDLLASVQTHTNAGDGHCGQTNGTYSVSVSSLDSGCYLTIYSDFCASNPTAVRIGQCTTLQNSIKIATFSVDCPQNNGDIDGYTTSLAAVAQTSSQSPTSFESTTSSQEPQQVSTTSIESTTEEPPQVVTTVTPSPSSSRSTSSSQEPQQVLTTSDSPTPEFSTSSSKDLQQTSSPASPLPTIASDLSSKTLLPSSSTARSSSSLSSPSETALGNGTKKGGLGKTDIILAAVFGSLGFIGITALLGGLWIRSRKKRKQRGREPKPQNNVVSRRLNDDAPDLLTLRSDSTAHNRSSRDLRPQHRRNGELEYDVNSDQSSMPTIPQGHPPFPSSMS